MIEKLSYKEKILLSGGKNCKKHGWQNIQELVCRNQKYPRCKQCAYECNKKYRTNNRDKNLKVTKIAEVILSGGKECPKHGWQNIDGLSFQQGKYAYCKRCIREWQNKWRAKNKDQIRNRERSYYAKNKDRIVQTRKENPNIKAYIHNYRTINKDKLKISEAISSKRRRENFHNGYIKKLILRNSKNLDGEDISILIDIKKAHLALKRKLKEIKIDSR